MSAPHDGEQAGGGRFSREPAATRGDGETTTMPAPATQSGPEPAREDPRPTGSEPHADAQSDGPEQRADTQSDGPEQRADAEPRDAAAAGTVGAEHMRAIRARQRAEFGGFAWGSAFFGWLVAFGVAVLLTGLLAAAGAATGLTDTAEQETIGLAGGIVLLLAVSIAYFCGGYVAGRLARFDGARNGFAVWLIGLLITAGLGVLAYVAGSEYNVLDRGGLPRLTVGDEEATTAGLVAMGAMLALTAIAAAVGGKAGERFHNRIDRHAVA